ncbi:MAG TPA: SRPBCC domain-containing protein [Chroococcales cyanobacterium]
MAPVDSFHIILDTSIKASAPRVFAALTTGIASWWGLPYFESREARNIILEPKVGGRLYEQWDFERGDQEGALLGTVIGINPPEYLRLAGCFAMADYAAHGFLTFRLSYSNGVTTVSLKHSVLGEVNKELEERYTKGWIDLMSRLTHLVEEGHSRGIKHDPSLHVD